MQSDQRSSDLPALRTVTLNVLFRDREERTRRVVDLLGPVEPDILLLQETSPEHASAIGEQLNMSVVGVADAAASVLPVYSAPALLCSNRSFVPEGDPLVLTGGGQSFGVLAKLKARGGQRVVVGSLHLQHTQKAGRLGYDRGYGDASAGRMAVADINDDEIRQSVQTRLTQIDIVERALLEYRSGFPVLLGGDFNCVPFGVEYRQMQSLGLEDSWCAGPRLGSRDTILEHNPLIGDGAGAYAKRLPSELPGSTGPLDYTLDFQFVSAELACTSAWVLGRPHEGKPEWVSDHLGLAGDYVLADDD